MKWRKLFRTLHRDIGYTAAALTIAYAISGVAVNHIADWNPSYAFDESAVDVGPLPTGSYEQMQRHVVAELGIDPASVKGHFMETGRSSACSSPTVRKCGSTCAMGEA